MGWQASISRSTRAAERRQLRQAAQRFREMERRAKEQSKLSEVEKSRQEVEAFDNRLELLLSVHKEQSDPWDWTSLAASLPPPPPQNLRSCFFKAMQHLAVAHPLERQSGETTVKHASLEDERQFEEAQKVYSEEFSRWTKVNRLARRILSGEHKAFIDALVELGNFSEISEIGSSIHFTVHHGALLESTIKVNGTQAIPKETKTLTASGKVATKPMAMSRFHEIYQDYVCGCMLRIAREVFALLPVETLLVTALVDTPDKRTGRIVEQAVMSAAMPRKIIMDLDYERLDPSDAMGNFLHRGDFKASRKSGAFEPIRPLIPADLGVASVDDLARQDVLVQVQKVRAEIKEEMDGVPTNAAPPT